MKEHHNAHCVMSVKVHFAPVLWDCPAYRKEELSQLLRSKFLRFLSLDGVEKTNFIMALGGIFFCFVKFSQKIYS